MTNAATGAPLASVTVEIITGRFAGQTTRTDDLGQFRFFAMSEDDVRLGVSVPGFETMTRGVNRFGGHASASFVLMPLPRTLSGRVTQAEPNQRLPIAGARVTLWNHFQLRSEQQVTTDPEGRFAASIVCPCQLRVEAEGYDPAERVSHPDYTPVQIQLSPKGRIVTETIGSPGGPRRPPTSFFRDVHQPGRIIVSKLYFYYSPGITATRTVEVWDGSRLVAAGSVNQQQWFADVLDVLVPGGTRYEIRITGGEWSAVTITSPI